MHACVHVCARVLVCACSMALRPSPMHTGETFEPSRLEARPSKTAQSWHSHHGHLLGIVSACFEQAHGGVWVPVGKPSQELLPSGAKKAAGKSYKASSQSQSCQHARHLCLWCDRWPCCWAFNFQHCPLCQERTGGLQHHLFQYCIPSGK